MAMAEELRPIIGLATWKDRASVARNAGKDTPLRELRSIVASASTVTLDEEGSEMLTSLRTSLTERVTALRERWVERITTSLDEGRVVDAVRASIRAPEPSARLSAELAVRLADAAGQAMSKDTRPRTGRHSSRSWWSVRCGGRSSPPGCPREPMRHSWPRPARPQVWCPSWPSCSGSRSPRLRARARPARPARPARRRP